MISTAKKIPRLRSPYYDKEEGYSTLVLTKKGKPVIHTLHELVAAVWVKKPSFVLPGYVLHVHHKIKVKENLACQPINLNFAESLYYTYTKYHTMLDKIKSMKYKLRNKWHTATEPEEIALAYGVSAYTIYELLYHEPQDIKGKDEIYKKDNITIKVRKEKS